MIIETPAEAGTFLLLAQQRPQSTADLPIKAAERAFMRVLEVGKPAFEHGVQVRHDASQTFASRAPCVVPDPFLESLQAFVAYIAASCFKPVAKEAETCSLLQTVANMRLIRVQRKTVFPNPPAYQFQRLWRVSGCRAKWYRVSPVASHASRSCPANA